jgi:hypothetical protein
MPVSNNDIVRATTAALLAKAQRDPGFRQLVDAAALRVLHEKAALGLLG